MRTNLNRPAFVFYTVFCILFSVFLLSIARTSHAQWAATYGGGGGDFARSIQQTSDGGYIMAGWTMSFGVGDEDVWVLKLKPDGTIDPPCDFIKDTNVSGIDSSATVTDTDANVADI
ncbi:MAG: hypothetical protein ACUZ77_03600, partial [Candidatus Brocadiales bacterium]